MVPVPLALMASVEIANVPYPNASKQITARWM